MQDFKVPESSLAELNEDTRPCGLWAAARLERAVSSPFGPARQTGSRQGRTQGLPLLCCFVKRGPMIFMIALKIKLHAQSKTSEEFTKPKETAEVSLLLALVVRAPSRECLSTSRQGGVRPLACFFKDHAAVLLCNTAFDTWCFYPVISLASLHQCEVDFIPFMGCRCFTEQAYQSITNF